jgi:hypothetical protein
MRLLHPRPRLAARVPSSGSEKPMKPWVMRSSRRYVHRKRRVLSGLAAVALAAVTGAVLIVLPARLEFDPAGGHARTAQTFDAATRPQLTGNRS